MPMVLSVAGREAFAQKVTALNSTSDGGRPATSAPPV